MSATGIDKNRALAGQGLSDLPDSAALAVVGGALDAFTYLGHGHVFANAMTGNVVLLGLNAVQGNWRVSLHHLLPIFSFFLGVWTAKAINLRFVADPIRNPDLAVISLEIAIFAILGCLPASAPHLLITVSVAFAASLSDRDLSDRRERVLQFDLCHRQPEGIGRGHPCLDGAKKARGASTAGSGLRHHLRLIPSGGSRRRTGHAAPVQQNAVADLRGVANSGAAFGEEAALLIGSPFWAAATAATAAPAVRSRRLTSRFPAENVRTFSSGSGRGP